MHRLPRALGELLPSSPEGSGRPFCRVLLGATALICALFVPTDALDAQASYHPRAFAEPLRLSRGSLSSDSSRALYLGSNESCRFVQLEYSWNQSACGMVDRVVFGHLDGIDTLIVFKPNSEGHVSFEAWDRGVERAIEVIWKSLVEGTRAQSEKLGIRIEPVRWYVYPTLDKTKAFMFYAVLFDWGGEPTLNVQATYFDRRGYIPLSLVPLQTDVPREWLERLLVETLGSYRPADGQSYLDFAAGDRIAPSGPIAVLATLLGASQNKRLAAAASPSIWARARYLWFLVLILPLILIRRWRDRRGSPSS